MKDGNNELSCTYCFIIVCCDVFVLNLIVSVCDVMDVFSSTVVQFDVCICRLLCLLNCYLIVVGFNVKVYVVRPRVL